MAEVVPVYKDGPETYVVNVTVDGGQLVQPDTGGKIKPAVVDSTSWLGVALYRAEPDGTTGEDTVYGQPRVDYGVPRSEVAVATTGVFKLLAAAALNFGDIVYCAAAGAVQKATTTGRAVGIVVETAGIANGARGKVRLFQ